MENWHEMSAEEWDKLVEHFDNYMDEVKEELERMGELQEEAAQKGAAEAPADMKSSAAAVLATAKKANKFQSDKVSKSQEIAMDVDIIVGSSETQKWDDDESAEDEREE